MSSFSEKIASQFFQHIKIVSKHYDTKVKFDPFFKTLFGFPFLDIYKCPIFISLFTFQLFFVTEKNRRIYTYNSETIYDQNNSGTYFLNFSRQPTDLGASIISSISDSESLSPSGGTFDVTVFVKDGSNTTFHLLISVVYVLLVV